MRIEDLLEALSKYPPTMLVNVEVQDSSLDVRCTSDELTNYYRGQGPQGENILTLVFQSGDWE